MRSCTVGPSLSISNEAFTVAVGLPFCSITFRSTCSSAIRTVVDGEPGARPSGDSHIGALSACTSEEPNASSVAMTKNTAEVNLMAAMRGSGFLCRGILCVHWPPHVISTVVEPAGKRCTRFSGGSATYMLPLVSTAMSWASGTASCTSGVVEPDRKRSTLPLLKTGRRHVQATGAIGSKALRSRVPVATGWPAGQVGLTPNPVGRGRPCGEPQNTLILQVRDEDVSFGVHRQAAGH